MIRRVQLAVYSPRFAISCCQTDPSEGTWRDFLASCDESSLGPCIRSAVARRYEIVPYTYSLALRFCDGDSPPVRWPGWGFESDPMVWESLKSHDSTFWFGDALLIAGVYEQGKERVLVYLPRASEWDLGYYNLHQPHEFMEAGESHEISTP